MSSKKSFHLEHSTQSIVNSCYPRYQHTAKNSHHLKSQGSIKGVTIKSFSLRGVKEGHHSTHQTVSKNSTHKKEKLRKYIYYERPETKLRTEHSSLSCSTHKNIRMNHSVSKDNNKCKHYFDSIENKKKSAKTSTKTKRLASSSDTTLKIKKVVPKKPSPYNDILNRTKNVLEGFTLEKKNW